MSSLMSTLQGFLAQWSGQLYVGVAAISSGNKSRGIQTPQIEEGRRCKCNFTWNLNYSQVSYRRIIVRFHVPCPWMRKRVQYLAWMQWEAHAPLIKTSCPSFWWCGTPPSTHFVTWLVMFSAQHFLSVYFDMLLLHHILTSHFCMPPSVFLLLFSLILLWLSLLTISCCSSFCLLLSHCAHFCH